MRTIKIANEKKRDAAVSFDTKPKERTVKYVLPDGSLSTNVKILKATMAQDLSSLVQQFGGLDQVGQQLILADPEIDFERSGILLDMVNKLYVTKNNQILYGVDLYEVAKNPDGSEKSRQLYTKSPGNINVEAPVQWTGKFFNKLDAVKMFVFVKKYQISHVNGLTFDFLYDMAKQLAEKNSLMLLSAGKKGNLPLIFHDGGLPYRGFLEGRVKGETYCLILHLTNLELKELV